MSSKVELPAGAVVAACDEYKRVRDQEIAEQLARYEAAHPPRTGLAAFFLGRDTGSNINRTLIKCTGVVFGL